MKFICSLLPLLLLGFPLLNHASSSDVDQQSLMLVGYDGEAWFPYVTKVSEFISSNDWHKIKKIRDPISVTRQEKSGDLFIKGNDNKLYRYQFSNRKLLPLYPSLSNKNKLQTYTQLRAHSNGLSMVQLLQGKSRETQLVTVNTSSLNPEPAVKPLFRQSSAQFHPLYFKNTLFYAHVSCRVICEPVIQEVWRHDFISRKTEQLTLLNVTSYLHSVDRAGRFAFLSSNKHGYYHIARLNLASNDLTWLTAGQVTDSFPSISSLGILYFIRRVPQGSQLVALMEGKSITKPINVTDGKHFKKIDIPTEIQKIRYLEISD